MVSVVGDDLCIQLPVKQPCLCHLHHIQHHRASAFKHNLRRNSAPSRALAAPAKCVEANSAAPDAAPDSDAGHEQHGRLGMADASSEPAPDSTRAVPARSGGGKRRIPRPQPVDKFLSNHTPCPFETALVHSRRRVPYSVGDGAPDRLQPWHAATTALSEDSYAQLTQRLYQVYEQIVPTEESNKRREQLLKKLGDILDEEWPDFEHHVLAFGSTKNNLCTDKSDVDVCIITDNIHLEKMCTLAAVLAKHGMNRVVCIPGAKVPIVRIWDPELQVACDMNINNTLALQNTRMIKTYVDLDPRVRPLAMLIKHWAKQRELNNAAGGGTLTSYTWMCLIINFLQTRKPPVLPVLHQIPHREALSTRSDEPDSSCTIGSMLHVTSSNGDCEFCDDVDELRDFGQRNTESLGELFFHFFRLYAVDFDYEHAVVSIRHGCTLSKMTKGWNLVQNNGLCVEEPFNTSRNLANTADEISIRGIRIELQDGFLHLLADQGMKDFFDAYTFPEQESTISPPLRSKSSGSMIQGVGNGNARIRSNGSIGTGRAPRAEERAGRLQDVFGTNGSSTRSRSVEDRSVANGARQFYHGRARTPKLSPPLPQHGQQQPQQQQQQQNYQHQQQQPQSQQQSQQTQQQPLVLPWQIQHSSPYVYQYAHQYMPYGATQSQQGAFHGQEEGIYFTDANGKQYASYPYLISPYAPYYYYPQLQQTQHRQHFYQQQPVQSSQMQSGMVPTSEPMDGRTYSKSESSSPSMQMYKAQPARTQRGASTTSIPPAERQRARSVDRLSTWGEVNADATQTEQPGQRRNGSGSSGTNREANEPASSGRRGRSESATLLQSSAAPLRADAGQPRSASDKYVDSRRAVSSDASLLGEASETVSVPAPVDDRGPLGPPRRVSYASVAKSGRSASIA